MNEEQKKGLETFRAYIKNLLDQTDMTEEEKEDCTDRCPGYLTKVVHRHLERTGVKDRPENIHSAILGFVGGYAARHLYAYHKKTEN